jgi:hypothetical protein
MTKKVLLLFQSTHDVIKAERVVRAEGFSVQVVPVPRSVSSECGMSLEVPFRSRNKVTRFLAKSGITVVRNLDTW